MTFGVIWYKNFSYPLNTTHLEFAIAMRTQFMFSSEAAGTTVEIFDRVFQIFKQYFRASLE
jgi:hypothetical protein